MDPALMVCPLVRLLLPRMALSARLPPTSTVPAGDSSTADSCIPPAPCCLTSLRAPSCSGTIPVLSDSAPCCCALTAASSRQRTASDAARASLQCLGMHSRCSEVKQVVPDHQAAALLKSDSLATMHDAWLRTTKSATAEQVSHPCAPHKMLSRCLNRVRQPFSFEFCVQADTCQCQMQCVNRHDVALQCTR